MMYPWRTSYPSRLTLPLSKVKRIYIFSAAAHIFFFRNKCPGSFIIVIEVSSHASPAALIFSFLTRTACGCGWVTLVYLLLIDAQLRCHASAPTWTWTLRLIEGADTRVRMSYKDDELEIRLPFGSHSRHFLGEVNKAWSGRWSWCVCAVLQHTHTLWGEACNI